MMFSKSRILASSLLAVSAAALVACGGDVAPTPVASANTVVTASPANSAAATTILQAAPASFPSGVPAFGTQAATTVTVSATAATYTPPGGTAITGPAFTVAAGSGTAKGVLTFGSCIFTVTESTIPTMKVGDRFVVTPCQATLGTAGTAADGAPKSTTLNLTLGTATSSSATVTTVVTTTGTVSLVSSSGATLQVGTTVTVTPTGG